ncbi:hypothetical protein ACIBCT_20910 [Streptosporangium sp. NPDC050855]|uniref:hypothetical protein n=1 Tax=Streptosporangium sp. NPDC050855 TaxID=3366194 RepID=UPI0037ABCECC
MTAALDLNDLDKLTIIDFRTGAVTTVTIRWQDSRRFITAAENANSHADDTTLVALASIRDASVVEVYLSADDAESITAAARAARPHRAL